MPVTLEKQHANADAVDLMLGRRLESRRRELGLSKCDLDRRLGLPPGSVGRIERAERRVSASMLFQLSEVLCVAPDFFFADAPPRSSSGAGPGPDRGGPPKEEITAFVEHYYRIAKPEARREILGLVRSVAASPFAKPRR